MTAELTALKLNVENLGLKEMDDADNHCLSLSICVCVIFYLDFPHLNFMQSAPVMIPCNVIRLVQGT